MMKKKVSTKKKEMRATSNIKSLPQDLIVEIVAQFISASPAPLSDLKNLRMTCKGFHAASKAKRVGRCVPVDKLWRLDGWNVPAVPFAVLGHLAEAGNLHACFILGLWGVYGSTSTESAGIESLNRAIAGGHKSAAYAKGILMLLGEPNTRSQGMELLISRAGPDMERCRTEVASLMRSISWRCRTKRCSSPRCGRGSEDEQSFCDLRCRFRFECKHGKWARFSCADPKCGRVEGWSELPTAFCSPSCRWRHEYLQLYKLI